MLKAKLFPIFVLKMHRIVKSQMRTISHPKWDADIRDLQLEEQDRHWPQRTTAAGAAAVHVQGLPRVWFKFSLLYSHEAILLRSNFNMQLRAQAPPPTRAQVQILALLPTTCLSKYLGLPYPFLKGRYDETLGFGVLKRLSGLLQIRHFLQCLTHNKAILSFPAAAAKSLQSCPTLCDPIDSGPPGSPVPGILQARTLEWVAISFSNA